MSTKKIEAFFAERGVKSNCEVCGQNSWNLPDDDAPMVVKLATQTPGPRYEPNIFAQPAPVGALQSGLGMLGGLGALGQATAPPPLPRVGNVNAYVAACTNCGNIRFHAEVIVKDAAGL